MLTRLQIDAKRALLRVLDKELTELTGRFLSREEQLRALSIGEEIDRIESALRPYEEED
jgi:hypothetical protein